MYVAGLVKALHQRSLNVKGTKLKLKVFVCLFKTPRHAESTHLLTSQLENVGHLYTLAALSASKEPQEPTGYSLLIIRT
jgi:hypothetical protein